MGRKTGISWTSATWNPVTGCSEVSPGCDHCYAKSIAERMRGPAFPNGFEVTLRPHKIRDPLKWKDGAMIFVNSMSDLFHREIPDDYIRQIWNTMLEADHHIYQVLTKRAHRMAYKIKELQLPTPRHIWLGVSAENQTFADNRIPALLSMAPPCRGSARNLCWAPWTSRNIFPPTVSRGSSQAENPAGLPLCGQGLVPADTRRLRGSRHGVLPQARIGAQTRAGSGS